MTRIPLSSLHRYLLIGSSAFLILSLFQGCNSTSTPRYATASAGVAHTLEIGTVVNSRRVIIDGQETMAGVYGGATGGAVVGAVTGAEVGGTNLSSAVGMAGGAILGAVYGPKLEKKLSSKTGDEILVELDGGKMVVLVQEVREPAFYPGERVRVHVNAYGNSRVFHMDEDPYVDPDTAAYLPPDFNHDLIEENTKKSGSD